MKHLILMLLFAGGMFTRIHAQQESVTLQWDSPAREYISEDYSFTYYSFEGAVYDPEYRGLPVYTKSFPVPTGYHALAWLTDATYEYLEEALEGVTLPEPEDEISLHVATGTARGQSFANIWFIPLRKDPLTGQWQKLVSFTLHWKTEPGSETATGRRSVQYASQSVLASGQWYMFTTERNGVYKLDYNFLVNQLKMNLTGIDPKNIRIYGNGGAMLPEKAGDPHPDDLVENAIEVVGGSDGSFDPGDYILMYGQGPDNESLALQNVNNSQRMLYQHANNLYDTAAHWFITTDLGPGKRISIVPSLGIANYTSGQADFHVWLEEDLHNLAESGREWYGQMYDNFYPGQTLSFTVPDLLTDSVCYLKAVMAGRSLAGNTQFRILYNSQTLVTRSITSVGTNYYDPYAREASGWGQFYATGNNLNIQVQFITSPSDPQSQGWLNYIDITGRRTNRFSNGQIIFRDRHTVAPGRVTKFSVQTNKGNAVVWDITDPLHPARQEVQFTGSALEFTRPTDSLLTFIVFDGSQYYTPQAIGPVPNQDIHGTIGQPDMVIVTHPEFLAQANELAQYHIQRDGLSVKVVTTQQVFNEFSSGNQDVTAIRNLMKMLYDRAGGNPNDMPRFLLLFGDGSYDYKDIQISKNTNTNFVPTYQSYESLNRASTFTSDDYFGMLDDNEGQNLVNGNQLLDIAIGRLPVETADEAVAVVNKIKHYTSPASLGDWRNHVTFVADDEDGNTHIGDANKIATQLEKAQPVLNIDKIYLDAYQQVSTPGGGRYPDVNEAINARIFSGTLIMNYTGHGGEDGWALERILRNPMVKKWKNLNNLPLFVTATCSFSRYDNPDKKTTGEIILVKADGGAIALVTTVRLVYSFGNYTLNKTFFSHIFEKTNGTYTTLGEALMHTKNDKDITRGANNRKFTLLGDPAMTLAYPQYTVFTTEVDNQPFVQNGDTLKALQKVTISAEVRDETGTSLLTKFNGIAFPTIYDKERSVTTLQNDPTSNKYTFKVRDRIIYKGKATVSNGKFNYTFVVPKDISYNFGSGKISYYVEDGFTDGNGYDSIMIGGTTPGAPDDNVGPTANLFMNDTSFVFGGITDKDPVLLVKLEDENGINTTGNIGHDITAVMDEDEQNKIILNDFYEAELDDYTRGTVKYPLNDLPEGQHQIRVKAWDVYNNSGEGYTEFIVTDQAELALSHVLNYPNPFVSYTEFWFEHNRPDQPLHITIEIFTVSGKKVKTISRDIVPEGYRVSGITWDGLDDFGNPIGKGAYIYKVNVRTDDGAHAEQWQKLVLLR